MNFKNVSNFIQKKKEKERSDEISFRQVLRSFENEAAGGFEQLRKQQSILDSLPTEPSATAKCSDLK